MPYKFVKTEATSDLQAFFDTLAFVKVNKDGYRKADRFKDFREVFSTDAGKRVLSQLINEAEGLPIIENEASDHAKMAFRSGKRSLGQWLVHILQAIPLTEE